jgi:hypothetical protein
MVDLATRDNVEASAADERIMDKLRTAEPSPQLLCKETSIRTTRLAPPSRNSRRHRLTPLEDQ